MAASANEECWGAQLQGLRPEVCGIMKDRNCRHFKSKFCEECRWAMAVPVTHVRALTQAMGFALENRHSFGLWTTAPKRMGSFRFRIINNTKECRGSRLVVFERPPPDDVPWAEVDPALVDDDGNVQLCVSKGTAVPIQHVKGRDRVAFLERAAEDAIVFPESPASSTTTSPTPSQPSSPKPSSPPPPPPTLCKVLVPSVLMQLANTAVPEIESPSSSSPSPTPRDKKMTRMQRNRQSAATSRERKRKYIADLEAHIAHLEHNVKLLRDENWFWRSLELDAYDATCPLMVCEWFSLT